MTESCEKEIAREKAAREILILKKKVPNEQIQYLEKESAKIIDLPTHILIKATPVSNEVIAKADEEKKKGISRAEARGETYVMPPHLCDIFAKIKAQENAVVENQRLSELNSKICTTNYINRNSRAYIEKKKSVISKNLAELNMYIAECDSNIRKCERRLLWASYAAKMNWILKFMILLTFLFNIGINVSTIRYVL